MQPSDTTLTLSEILSRLQAAEAPQPQWGAELRRIAAAYPASAVAPAALLRYYSTSLSAEEQRHLKAVAALGTGDPTAAALAVDPALDDFKDFYPPAEAPKGPDTDDTIDLFLRTYGHSSPQEDALLERMIFNPVPEYAETLAREEEPHQPAGAAAGSQDALIDAFLAANPPGDAPAVGEPDREVAAPTHSPAAPQHKPKSQQKAPQAAPQADSMLSESLAKIFIKQGRYERAYEIISNISLNYPKKSIYFADQLRFLQKLIDIQRAGGLNVE